MSQKERKLGFGGIVLSQIFLLGVGMLLIIKEIMPWQLWGEHPWRESLAAVVAALGTYGVLYGLFRRGGQFIKRLLADLDGIRAPFQGFSWGQITCVAILAGVSEELLFRVGLQGLFVQYLSPSLAILASAVIFGLLHFISWPYFLLATLMGGLFGVVYHWTQSAMLVILWHALYDLIALGVMVKYPQMLGLADQPVLNPDVQKE